MLLPPLKGLLGFRLALGQENVGTINNLLRRRLPAVQRALLAIVARRLAHDLEWSKRNAEAEVMARGKPTGLTARPQGVGGRVRLLKRARPDRDRPVLEMG
jgi:hypothetical protein